MSPQDLGETDLQKRVQRIGLNLAKYPGTRLLQVVGGEGSRTFHPLTVTGQLAANLSVDR